MTPDEYLRVGELYSKVRDMPEHERAAVLDQECASKPELRRHIIGLLEVGSGSHSVSFLDRPAIHHAADLIARQATRLPEAGATIGAYRLGERIGAGGMGVVFQAEDLRLNRTVAVKVLPLLIAAEGPERIARFQREVRAVSLLNHPNIVSIFDAAFDQGYYYMAMEFVEGKTLRQLMVSDAGGFETRTILDWVSQAASALSAAHGAGIVHRDIKPENIMVRPDGYIKVLDFGLAKLLEQSNARASAISQVQTRTGRVAGTIQYLSPEQVIGRPATAPSDLFSLGVVTYELVTGVRPFDGPTDGAIFDAILNRAPAAPSSVRPAVGIELDNLILRALEKDPELRFQTASDFRSACQRISRDYLIRSPLPDRAQASSSGSTHAQAARTVSSTDSNAPVSRRKWVLAALGGTAVTAGAIGVLLRREEPPPRVLRITQVTRDRHWKSHFVTDGARLYFSAGRRDPASKMFQVGVRGGEPIPIPRLNGLFPFDMSRDGSELLLGKFLASGTLGPYPVWISDSLGNSPRRAGDLVADNARWSPDSDRILYTTGPELRIANRDGSASRTLAAMSGHVASPVYSPDGRSIRFTVSSGNKAMFWEMGADGGRPRVLIPEWADQAQENGTWTPDGKRFVFSAAPVQTAYDLWMINEAERSFFGKAPSPVRLTTGPIIAQGARVSPDGRHIYFVGGLNSGELVRYDPKAGQWSPYMNGIAAMHVEFSKDGRWVTWVDCPHGTVWRSAMDGSDQLQLTAPPYFFRNPRWSPDGKEIVFYGEPPGKPARVYAVSASGGSLRQVTNGESGPAGEEDGCWSPDGGTLVFGTKSADSPPKLKLFLTDLKTRRTSAVPGTEGLWSPRWSPDGRYFAAMGLPNKLWLYDRQTESRRQLTDFGVGFPSWSRDSRYVYFENDTNTSFYRVSVAGGIVEEIAPLGGIRMANSSLGWVGLAPDGSLISARATDSSQLYALEWETS